MLDTHYPSAVLFFFFNDTATTEIYTLSLHDALPISDCARLHGGARDLHDARRVGAHRGAGQQGARQAAVRGRISDRSEEHTSELQSQSNLVCRLLLEKKKQNTRHTHIHQNYQATPPA